GWPAGSTARSSGDWAPPPLKATLARCSPAGENLARKAVPSGFRSNPVGEGPREGPIARASARLGEGGGEAGEFFAQGPGARLLERGGGVGLADELEDLALVARAVGDPGGDEEGAGQGGVVGAGPRDGLVDGRAGALEVADVEQGVGAGDEEGGELRVVLAEGRAAAGEGRGGGL